MFLRRPQHALLPWRVIFVLTFLFVLAISGLVTYVNSAFSTSCGTTTTSGDYTIVSFTTVGSCNWTVPNYVNTVDVLVVGGGGGGGSSYDGVGGGGGGAGGYLSLTSHSISQGNYTVTVGDGGVANPSNGNTNGTNGGSSSFGTQSVAGGGGGSAGRGSPNDGASGGGAGGRWGYNNSSGLAGGGGLSTSASPVLGFAGGNTGSTSSSNFSTGGGGGGSGSSGRAGNSVSSGVGGLGGNGTSNSITGSTITYAAGGSGGSTNLSSNGSAGASGTGNGGGGASILGNTTRYGGNGGSGIVVIKFISQCNPTISTNLTLSYRYSFTTTGVCNWVAPSSSTSFKALVVGAGGGGGYDSGGGGGGGAISYNSSITFNANEILTLTIGAGGTGGTSGAKTGVTGGTSSLIRSGSTIASSLGGSGGGGCTWNGSSCQGINAGGSGGSATASGWTTYSGASGGRGFMYSAGSAAVNGTDGTSFFANYYSGGGGGGTSANGGLGGGGNGSGSVAGTANTGGGGGGGLGNTNGGIGASGVILFVNDFDVPTISWTTPSADEIVNSASYTPSWTLSDSSSGISSSSGTAKRQYAELTSGTCGSWITEDTQTRGSPITLTANRCYRWTFDSSLATGVVLPTDNIGTALASNLTSSTVKYDPAPTITSIVSTSDDGIYNQSKTITFTITFSETVTVTGSPVLTLETGSSDLEATCSQNSASTTMTCSATVRSTDTSSDLDYVSTSALTLPSGVTIQDLYALNNAQLTLPTPGQSGSIAYAKNIVVAGNSSTSATGGAVTYANGYAVHTYTSTSAGQSFIPSSTGSYDILTVGAGGGGASGVGSGGGGGAVVEQTLSLTASTSYAITIGTGGAGHATQATSGTSTTFSSLITAPGGTGGKSRYFCQNGIGGNPGGGNGAKTGNTYPENIAENGSCTGKTINGGDGTLSSITGNYYGGGGGRGGENSVAALSGGIGGLGGGGNGGNYVSGGTNGFNATANTGGGGGGGSEGSTLGGNGAAGIIVIRYKIDNEPPVINWSTPNAASFVSTASYTPVWSVTESGIAGISSSGTVTRQYKSLSSGSCAGSWTNDGTFSSNTAQTLTANRCYQWIFTTAPVDNASNTTTLNLTSSTVIYDATAPTVSSFTATTVSPTANTTLEYALSFSEEVTGLSADDFTVSGWSVSVTSGSGSGPYVINLTRTTASDGSVSLVLGSSAVTDTAGNTLSSTLLSRTAGVISYDGTAPTTPTITLNSSACSELRNTSATATFSASDASSGIAGYRYTTDGSVPNSSSTAGNSVTISSQGSTTVKVKAIDNVGNLSSTASCVIDIDYVVPLGIWSSQPSTPTSLTSLSYTLTFDENVTGLSSSDFSVSGTATSCSVSVSGSGSTYSVTLASCSQGTIQITLLANSVTDAYGNAGPAANASATQVTRSVLSATTVNSTLAFTYGTAISATTPVSGTGGISTLTYSISPSLPTGLTLNSSNGEITGTPTTKSSSATYTISIADSATTATSTFTLAVAAKGLVITASSPSVTYGDPVPTITPSYSGFVNGDTDSLVSGTTCSTTYTTTSAVNTTPTTSCSGSTATNYSISFVSGSVTISKANQTALTVSTSSANGIYGSSVSVSSSGGSGTGSVSFSVSSGNCSLSGTTLSNTSAGDCYLVATKAADTNFNSVSSASTKFVVNKKALVLIPSSPSVDYGQSYSPTIIDTNSALVGSDAISSATYSYSTPSPVNAGSYTITPSSAVFSSGTSDNYTITYATSTLTISQINQSTLTAVLASSSIEYPQSTTISATGGSGSGAITYSATGDCTVSGATVTSTSAGSCSITATKAASTNYLATNSSPVVLTITADSTSPTATITAGSGIYSNSDTLTYSIVFSESVTGLTGSDFTATGWTKTVSGSGSSYTLTLTSPTGSVVDGTITVILASGAVTDGTNSNLVAVTNTETTRDTVAPTSTPVFVNVPAESANDSSPQIVFGGATGSEIYQCKIDSGSYATCSQSMKFSNLSIGSHKLYLRIADLAGNYTQAIDYSWTIIVTSSGSNSTKVSVTPTPTVKVEVKPKKEEDKITILNPLAKIPDVIKPLIDKLPFIPGESLVAKELKPNVKIQSETKPLEIVDGKTKTAELKIVEEKVEVFINKEDKTQSVATTQAVALVVENNDGNYVKVSPVADEGPKVDTQNQRIIVTAGAQITVEANGYAPNAEFALWLRSDPVFIGRGVTNRFGEINATFNVPKNIPLGDHKIELNGLTNKKEVRSVAVPATVIKYTNPGNIQLVTENPVEKYLNGLSVLMSLLFLVLMVGVWAVGATIRDQRLLRARIRN